MDSFDYMVLNCTSPNVTNSSGCITDDSALDNVDGILWKRMCGFGVIVVGIPANLMVIVCLWRDQSSRVSGFSTYACSIAFTDFFVGVILMPVRITTTYRPTWYFGLTGCILWYIGDFGLTSVSMLLFLAMGYDRYRCVTAPLKYRSQFRRSRTIQISVFVWIVGFFLWSPYVFLKILLFEEHSFRDRCYLALRPNVLEIIQFILGYCIPMSALVAVNVALLLKLKEQNPPLHPLQGITFSSDMKTGVSAVNSITTLSNLAATVVKQRNRSVTNTQNLLRTSRSRNVTSYKVILMVMLFLFFWLPFCILWLLLGVCNGCIPEAFVDIFGDVVFVQSAINPLIAIFTSHQIRLKIHEMILRIFPRPTA